MIIDILDWNLSYTDLIDWVIENNVVLDAIDGYGDRWGTGTKYIFQNEEDFIAFKLKFTKTPNNYSI